MTTLSPTQSGKRCYYGVVQGIVADVDDPEKEGRVRVTSLGLMKTPSVNGAA